MLFHLKTAPYGIMSPSTTEGLQFKVPDVKKIEFSRRIFTEVSNIKLHENPASGGHADTSGQTDMWRNLTKVIL
jgi:hypothetical protein